MTNQAPERILVVDDEMPIRTTMTDLLRRRGYLVENAPNGEEALGMVAQQPFDLLLLDLKMPGMSGIELAQRARERQPGAAIIILTGHGSLDSAIDGLHLGVFDYMLKTASPQDVIARVAAALKERREAREKESLLTNLYGVVSQLQGAAGQGAAPAAQATGAPAADQWIEIGALHISLWRQTARLGGQTLSLTPTEFRLLGALAQQAGRVLSYQQLLRSAQGYDAETAEAAELVKPHIYHLRQKIEADPANPRYILTVRGTGYMLKVSDGPSAG